MASIWKSYNDLAWTEDLLVDPADYEDEVRLYVDLIQGITNEPLHWMLHLGCGAGGHDTFFKKKFAVTGVDLSVGMLNKAKETHPDIEYLEGDMRTIRLDRKFDVVVIPDSIDYMVTLDDLKQALKTCIEHLRPGGVVLIVAKTEEAFQNNNFAYEGSKDDIQVTLLENNYVYPSRPNTYEATFVYLIRQQGALSIQTETQTLGLFPLSTWEALFEEFGLKVQNTALNDLYEKNLLGDGDYPMTVFVGQKP